MLNTYEKQDVIEKKEQIVLSNGEITLRPLKTEDAYDMFAYCSLNEIADGMTWDAHQSIEDTKAFIDYTLNRLEGSNDVFLAIEVDGVMVGSTSLLYVDNRHHVAELGYMLNPAYAGRGIVTKAVNLIMAHGFEEMAMNRIQARCFIDNAGSENVMKRVGMEFEGILRKRMFVKGHYHDMKMYSILREEWN